MKITEEILGLFTKCRSALGAPLVKVELTDQQLCDLLSMSIEDYAERVQNWLIENQWATLYGKNITNIDMAYALSVRTLDMSRDFSYWFSRLDTLGFAGGYGQAGGGSFGPIGGFYIAQSMDIAYMATDLAYKNRLLRGDLTYKVTAGPEGTRIIHLYSTPGSKLSFGSVLTSNGSLSLVGCQVWYTYYDVANAEDADECRRQNPNVMLTPDQVPLDKIDFAFLNEPTKTIVRKLFIAKAKQTLALVRGKFSGKVNIHDAEMQLDYALLSQQADKEYDAVMESIDKRLERMTPYYVMQKQAELMDSMAKVLGGKPMKMIVV